MSSLISDLSIAVVMFASTNIDDILLLAAFFANPLLHHRAIVLGQYLGIGMLVLTSALAALLALALPIEWIALLGIAPLLLGLSKLLALFKNNSEEETGDVQIGKQEQIKRGLWPQVFAIASITIANGGDNIGVYVPLFATNSEAIITCTFVFAVMTGVWCALGYLLVNNRILGHSIRRYGHIVLPFVLIALGMHILSDSLTLLH